MAKKNQDGEEQEQAPAEQFVGAQIAQLRKENEALRNELRLLETASLKAAQVDAVLLEEIGTTGGLSNEHLAALAQLKKDCPEMPHSTAVEVVLRQSFTAKRLKAEAKAAEEAVKTAEAESKKLAKA